jgi:hypothetical protein
VLPLQAIEKLMIVSGAAIDANSAQVLARSHDPTAIANKQAALSEVDQMRTDR